MPKRTNNKKSKKRKVNKKQTAAYNLPEGPLNFYISEETASYGNNGKKYFTLHYDNPEHSVRFLRGNCIEILNRARENSVDMIFADPPFSSQMAVLHVMQGKWYLLIKAYYINCLYSAKIVLK